MQRRHSALFIAILMLAMLSLAGQSLAAVMYLSNTVHDSNTSFNGVTYNALASKGLAFTAGPAGPYPINVMDMVFYSASVLSNVTFKMDLRNTTSTTPGSAFAGTTVYATDILTVSSATTGYFGHTFTAADFPNIAAFALQSGASYSLTLYGASNNSLKLGRNGAAGYGYAPTSGFTVLDSLTGGVSNYAGAYDVGIGSASSPVPEPSTCVLFSLGLGGLAFWKRRQKKA